MSTLTRSAVNSPVSSTASNTPISPITLTNIYGVVVIQVGALATSTTIPVVTVTADSGTPTRVGTDYSRQSSGGLGMSVSTWVMIVTDSTFQTRQFSFSFNTICNAYAAARCIDGVSRDTAAYTTQTDTVSPTTAGGTFAAGPAGVTIGDRVLGLSITTADTSGGSLPGWVSGSVHSVLTAGTPFDGVNWSGQASGTGPTYNQTQTNAGGTAIAQMLVMPAATTLTAQIRITNRSSESVLRFFVYSTGAVYGGSVQAYNAIGTGTAVPDSALGYEPSLKTQPTAHKMELTPSDFVTPVKVRFGTKTKSINWINDTASLRVSITKADGTTNLIMDASGNPYKELHNLTALNWADVVTWIDWPLASTATPTQGGGSKADWDDALLTLDWTWAANMGGDTGAVLLLDDLIIEFEYQPAAPSGPTLVVSDSQHLNIADTVVLTQVHTLATPPDSRHLNTADAVALVQQHTLGGVADTANANIADTTAVSVSTTLANVADTANLNIADTVALTQVHTLAAPLDARHLNIADTVVLVQQHTLAAPPDSRHLNIADTVVLTQAHTLAGVADTAHPNIADAVVLSASATLAVVDTANTNTSDTVVLTQVHTLAAPPDSRHLNIADTVALTQVHTLAAPADSQHPNITDAISLGVAGDLVVADTANGNTSDTVVLVQQHTLAAPLDSRHLNVADTVVLTQQHTLAAPLDSRHLNTTDTVSLVAAGDLVVADTQNRHTTDPVALTQIHLLVAPLGSYHDNTIDTVVLQGAGLGLEIAILTCFVDGPAVRRVVMGPETLLIWPTGPSNAPAERAFGPAVTARTPAGPALITKVVRGPAVESLNVRGPDVSVDVMGPAIEPNWVVTGPGACNGD